MVPFSGARQSWQSLCFSAQFEFDIWKALTEIAVSGGILCFLFCDQSYKGNWKILFGSGWWKSCRKPCMLPAVWVGMQLWSLPVARQVTFFGLNYSPRLNEHIHWDCFCRGLNGLWVKFCECDSFDTQKLISLISLTLSNNFCLVNGAMSGFQKISRQWLKNWVDNLSFLCF